jgi:hypothetical protein
VSHAPAGPSILLLTEDSAKDAHDTLAALAKKMLQILVPECGTHLIDFRPANDDAKRAMHANLWKSENPKDHRKNVDLVRTIARKINEPGGASFVFFHVDGDRRFSQRESSENRRKFADRIRFRVQQLIEDELRKKDALADTPAVMGRLHLLMPFYSIEAWLYQNTREAIRICHAEHAGADVERFEAWEQNRAALEEEEKPKEQVCLRDHHNLALAKSGFPASEVYDARTSLTEAVDGLLDCADLTRALDRTCGRLS